MAVFDFPELTNQLETFKVECLSHTAKECRNSEELQGTIREALTEQLERFSQLADDDKQAVIDRFGSQGRRRVKID